MEEEEIIEGRRELWKTEGEMSKRRKQIWGKWTREARKM